MRLTTIKPEAGEKKNAHLGEMQKKCLTQTAILYKQRFVQNVYSLSESINRFITEEDVTCRIPLTVCDETQARRRTPASPRYSQRVVIHRRAFYARSTGLSAMNRLAAMSLCDERQCRASRQ